MAKVWNIGYRFDPRTGNVKPWEVINTVKTEAGKTELVRRWGSFKTEAAAVASIPKAIAKMEADKIYQAAGNQYVNIGRIK